MPPPLKLNLRQLEVFRALMDSKTATEAAHWLGITQPAVSTTIAALEQAIGVKLFERHRKRLIPTAEGETFHREVERIFRGIDRLAVTARTLAAVKVGHLNIILPQALVLGLIPDAIKLFHAKHPRVALTIEYLPSKEAVDHVASNLADFAIARLPIAHPGIEYRVIMRSESVCAIPAGHPLARHEAISPLDLEHESLVLQSRRHEARFAIDDAFRALGIEPKVGIETGALTAACAYAVAGIGITIIDGLMANAFADRDIVIRRFHPPIVNEFAAVFPRDSVPSILAGDFLACVDDVLRRAPPFGVSSMEPAV